MKTELIKWTKEIEQFCLIPTLIYYRSPVHRAIFIMFLTFEIEISW